MAERDQLMHETLTAEDEQQRLLQNVQSLWKQNQQSTLEIEATRMQIDLEDQSNIDERKELEYLEDSNKVKKQLSDNLFKELSRLRAIDKELQEAIDSTRELNQQHKDDLKKHDATIDEICTKRNKEAEAEADTIEKATKL